MAETHQEVVKVWIAPGCIVCDACETDCPEVFDVQEETCIIKPDAGKADFTKPLTPSIIVAAEGCPVDVIKFEMVEVQGPEPWAGEQQTAAADSGAAPAAKAKVAEEPIPVGPPDPKWASLLETAHIKPRKAEQSGESSSRTPVKVTAELLADAMPDDAPPDAMAAAGVGTGFIRPRPSVKQKIEQQGQMSRRTAVAATAGAGAVLMTAWGALAATAATLGAALQAFMVPKVTKEPPALFRAGKLSDYAEDNVYTAFKGSQGVWVVRKKNKIFVLSTTCTHLGCIPNWLSGDAKFKCPCHGSGFYMDGVNFEGPAPRPLERYKVAIQDGVLIVDKSVKYRSELGQWGQPGSEVVL